MADLPSSFSKVNDVEVAQDAPATENLLAKLGSNTNYLYDDALNVIKGPGPLQTLTQLKARVDNASNVANVSSGVQVFLGRMSVFTGFNSTVGPTKWHSILPDPTYRVVTHTGVGTGNISQSFPSGGDTGIVVANNRWFQWGHNSTFANMTLYVNVWEYTSV